MEIELTPQQLKKQQTFQAFVDKEIVPDADKYDQAESVPPEIIKKMAEIGYLGAIIPKEHSGKEAMDATTFGLLCEEIGRGSASLLSLLTVHSMVCQAISN